VWRIAASATASAAMAACVVAAGPGGAGGDGAGSDDDASPPYTESTTILMDQYGMLLGPDLPPDLDGDGLRSDRDFLGWLIWWTRDIEIRDTNADGAITCEDVIEEMSVTLAQLAGDIDADGSVTAADLGAMMTYVSGDDQPARPKIGDVNADGSVDQSDADLVMQCMGDVLDPSPFAAATAIVEMLDACSDEAFHA
jgi:hypothetical protein